MSVPEGWRLGDHVLGIEGLAILRSWLTDLEAVSSRVGEISEIVQRLDHGSFSEVQDAPARRVDEGYEAWSETYDEIDNPLLEAELRAIAPLLDSLEPGRVLDAACGTGRHSHYLAALRGHRVVGVYVSTQMLAKARKKSPEAALCRGDLLRLPLADQCVDAAVCALALTHIPDLKMPISELSRVVRKGGRLIISDVHPMAVTLGAHALYKDAEGRFGFVRNYLHWHSHYVAAFKDAGLAVNGCLEMAYSERELATFRMHQAVPRAYEIALGDLPMILLWDLERR